MFVIWGFPNILDAEYLDVWVCWRCERSKVMASTLVVVALERVLGDALATLHPFYSKGIPSGGLRVGIMG